MLYKSQAINKGPIDDVEEHKRKREAEPRALVDPDGDLLRGHGGPGVLAARRVRALAVAPAATRGAARAGGGDQLVVALRRDRRQVQGGWETLEDKTKFS